LRKRASGANARKTNNEGATNIAGALGGRGGRHGAARMPAKKSATYLAIWARMAATAGVAISLSTLAHRYRRTSSLAEDAARLRLLSWHGGTAASAPPLEGRHRAACERHS